ncbi:MAG: DUF721 domain-containing protein [Actinomycetota bacterium]
MPKKGERSEDPVGLGDIVSGLLQQRPFAQGAKIGKLAAGWASVVGDRLANETAPVRLESGTLTVAVSTGPWGSQAKFLAEEIRKKANESLGEGVVERVRIVVSEDRPKPL